MKLKDKTEIGLEKSKNDRWTIRLTSSFPAKDVFDGIVLHYSSELVIIHELRDFQFDGIVAINRKKISKIRDGEFEACENNIIRDSGTIKELSKIQWIKKKDTFRDLISEIMKKKIWPAVEMASKKSNGFYVGPITSVKQNMFSLFCYDAKGKWENEYDLEYNRIGKVEFKSRYTDFFNDFMKRKNPFSKTVD